MCSRKVEERDVVFAVMCEEEIAFRGVIGHDVSRALLQELVVRRVCVDAMVQ